MKKLYFLISLFCCVHLLHAQEVRIIGDTSAANNTTAGPFSFVPTGTIPTGYRTFTSLSLYTPQDIEATGWITSLAWKCYSSTSPFNNILSYNIYIAPTTFGTVNGINPATATIGATLVYSGSFPSFSVGSWLNFDITDYLYTGGNFIIIVQYNYNSPSSPLASFYGMQTSFTSYLREVMVNSTEISGSNINVRPTTRFAFRPALNDVALGAIINPTYYSEPGAAPVQVVIKNTGTSTLLQATISVALDDTLKFNYPWTGALNAGDSSSVVTSSLNIPQGNHTVKVWVSEPNGVTDSINFNDTLSLFMPGCYHLSGAYSIGTGGDFSSAADAATAIMNCGIKSDVTLSFLPGEYNGQFMLGTIYDEGGGHTITLCSSTGNPADVILNHTDNANSAYGLIYLNKSKNIIIKNLTLQVSAFNSPTTIYLDLIIVCSNDSNIRIVNNIFKYGTSDLQGYCVALSNCKYIQVDSNSFSYISAGIFSENGTGLRILNNNIISGHMDTKSVGAYAIYISTETDFAIQGNTITFIPGSGQGIYISSCPGKGDVSYNSVQVTEPDSINYYFNSLEIYGSFSHATPLQVYNNFFVNYLSQSGAILLISPKNVELFYNSIFNKNAGYALDFYYGVDSVSMYDNILVNADTAGTLYNFYNGGLPDLNSDNNDLYPGPGTVSSTYATIQDWISGMKLDSHSVSINPGFVGINDLHISNDSLCGISKNLYKPADDIDKKPRISYCLGADEISEIVVVTGLVNAVTETSVKVYPNPVTDILSLFPSTSKTTLWQGSLISITGATVKTIEFNSEYSFSVAGLPKGLYILELNTKGNDSEHFKLIVE